jgi:hypothetical protein
MEQKDTLNIPALHKYKKAYLGLCLYLLDFKVVSNKNLGYVAL